MAVEAEGTSSRALSDSIVFDELTPSQHVAARVKMLKRQSSVPTVAVNLTIEDAGQGSDLGEIVKERAVAACNVHSASNC